MPKKHKKFWIYIGEGVTFFFFTIIWKCWLLIKFLVKTNFWCLSVSSNKQLNWYSGHDIHSSAKHTTDSSNYLYLIQPNKSRTNCKFFPTNIYIFRPSKHMYLLEESTRMRFRYKFVSFRVLSIQSRNLISFLRWKHLCK